MLFGAVQRAELSTVTIIWNTMIEARHLVGDTDDTTGRAGSGVASLERLLVVALSKVVSATVDNDSSLKKMLA